MSKLGKHILQQSFDVENNIDLNYAIFTDSFTFSGIPGSTAFGIKPSIDELYYDYTSISHWSDVRDVMTYSSVFIRDEINTLYLSGGGSISYSGLTQSDKEALSKNFLISKSERDLIHNETEQQKFAAELILNTNEYYAEQELKDAVDYISIADDTDIQIFLDNPSNFLSGGGGSVSSVNGKSGIVIMGLNDLADVNSSDVSNDHVLTYNGSNWTTDLRPKLKIHADSQNYMNFNPITGELFLEKLAITDVTVNTTAVSSDSYFSSPTHCDSHQEGDTVVFTGTLTGTEIWMHNGGSTLTKADYVMLENPNASDPYIRDLFSAQSPIIYDIATGVISITQSGTTSNGYLSMSDYNYFDSKVDIVNGKVGEVILTTSDIEEGTNKYYCKTEAYLDFNSGTGLSYNNETGTYWANINDGATGGSGSESMLWSAQKTYQEVLLASSNKKSWSWGASYNGSTTNSYLLKSGSTPSDESPYVTFMNSEITDISAYSSGTSSWISEVMVNDLVFGTMSVTGGSSNWSTLSIILKAGDKISLYCNGVDVISPNIEILLREI